MNAPTTIASPFKRLRELSGLTLDELQFQTGKSRSWILRQEQGCYPEPDYELLGFYYTNLCAQTPPLLDPSTEVPEWAQSQRNVYYAFQIETRRAHGPATSYASGRGLTDLAEWPDHGLVLDHPLVSWRKRSSTSQIEISKFYCVHPAMVYRFENRPLECISVPETLIVALLEAGFSASLLESFKNSYHRYRARLTNRATDLSA